MKFQIFAVFSLASLVLTSADPNNYKEHLATKRKAHKNLFSAESKNDYQVHHNQEDDNFFNVKQNHFFEAEAKDQDPQQFKFEIDDALKEKQTKPIIKLYKHVSKEGQILSSRPEKKKHESNEILTLYKDVSAKVPTLNLHPHKTKHWMQDSFFTFHKVNPNLEKTSIFHSHSDKLNRDNHDNIFTFHKTIPKNMSVLSSQVNELKYKKRENVATVNSRLQYHNPKNDFLLHKELSGKVTTLNSISDDLKEQKPKYPEKVITIYKDVPVEVPVLSPLPIEKKVLVPYKVPVPILVTKRYPVYIPQPVPVVPRPVMKPASKNWHYPFRIHHKPKPQYEVKEPNQE